MKNDYRHMTLARSIGLTERAILWSMIVTVLVVAAGMIKGIVG